MNRRVEGDQFFYGTVAPVLRRTSLRAREEVRARVAQMLAVPSAAERDSVRALVKDIQNGRMEISQGANPWIQVVKLVDVVAKKDKGPQAFLERFLAMKEISGLYAQGRIKLDVSRISDTLREAMESDPYPRGALLLPAILKAEIHREELRGSVLNPRGREAWFTEPPHSNDEQDMTRWERLEMIEFAARWFANLEPQFFEQMTLHEWETSDGTLNFSSGAEEREEAKIPKSVIRMNPRAGRNEYDGRWQEMMRICSLQLQTIAAALGVPFRVGADWRFGVLQQRNLTVLQGYSLHPQESSSTVKRGIGIDPLVVTGELEEAEGELVRLHGLQDIKVANIPFGAAQIVSMVRVLRDLRDRGELTIKDFADQLKAVRAGARREMAKLRREARVVQFFKSGHETVQTSIVQSLAQEIRLSRGMQLSEDEVVQAMEKSIVVGLLGSEFGHPRIRGENSLLRLARRWVQSQIPQADLREHPLLATGGVHVETIRRVRAKEPEGGIVQGQNDES